MRRALLSFLLLGVFLPSAAALAADGPKPLIDAKYAEIKKIIASDKTEEGVRKKVVAVLESFTDFREFGRLTVRKDWEGWTEAQRTLFVDRYRLLIHRSYAKHFKANQSLEVRHRGEPQLVGDKALVRTTVISGKTEAEVDYKMHRLEGEFRVYDLVIDEVSLMRNYRKQFTKILKQNGDKGFSKLIEKINKKIDKGEE